MASTEARTTDRSVAARPGLGFDPHQPLLSSSVGRPPSRGAASRGSLPHPLLPSVPGPVLSLFTAPRSMPLPSWSGVELLLPWKVPSGFVLEPDGSVSVLLPCSDDADATATAASCFSDPLPCPFSLSAYAVPALSTGRVRATPATTSAFLMELLNMSC